MDNQQQEQEKSISLSDIWYAIWKHRLIVLIITAVITAIGSVYTFFIAKPDYKSSSNVIVCVQTTSTGGTSTDTIDYNNSLRVVNTVGDLVKDDVVLDPIAAKYETQGVTTIGLRKQVSASVSTTSFMITISVVDRDQDMARVLTDEVVSSLIDVCENNAAVKELKVSLSQTRKASQAVYNSPNKTLYLGVSVLGGLVVACVTAFIIEFASNTFKSKDEIESYFPEINVVGKFYEDEEAKKRNKAAHSRQASRLIQKSLKGFEPYNNLLTNIFFASPENPYKVICITSSNAGELKSKTIANTAYCAATNGKKVIVVDLDTRKPTQHKIFGVSKSIGFVNYITGQVDVDHMIKHTSAGVDIITTGINIVNPTALITSQKAKELIKELRERYDYIFIDTPPVYSCTDILHIAPLADGVVYNVAVSETKKNLVKECIAQLKQANVNIIGISCTKYPWHVKNDYYYYYRDNYGVDALAAEEAALKAVMEEDKAEEERMAKEEASSKAEE